MIYSIEAYKVRQQKLKEAAEYLKTRFFGIDEIIDEILSQIKVWYLMPELLTRPVIINLWGMTGVGKTDLIRKLVDFLNLRDNFAEVELSNSQNSGYFKWSSSIAEVLHRSNIDNKRPSIIFFDEIQKFRTIDQDGKDIETLQFQDFWELLSDGKLSIRDLLFEMNDMIIESSRKKKKMLKETPDDPKEDDYAPSWLLSRYKTYLELPDDFELLGNLKQEEFYDLIQQKLKSGAFKKDLDYSKSLIIISGNLDEAYEMAKRSDEADVDADIFYAQTKKITIIDIKEALSKKFRPEQISRFGNTHIIYPSLKESDYKKIINNKLTEFSKSIKERFDISISFDDSIEKVVYENGVFPVQGVRPLLSTITDIVENNVVTILLETIVANKNKIHIKYNPELNEIESYSEDQKFFSIKYQGKVDTIRKKRNESFRKIVAVHEAGHAFAYGLLFKIAPLQIKTNTASTNTGGFTFSHFVYNTKENIKLKVQVLLAGQIAEEVIFGNNRITSGSGMDIEDATMLVSDYYRRFGLDDSIKTNVSPITNVPLASRMDTNFEETNSLIRSFINQQRESIKRAFSDSNNIKILKELAFKLLDKGELSAIEFKEVMDKYNYGVRVEPESYEILEGYEIQQDA